MIRIEKAGAGDATLLTHIAVQAFMQTHEAGVPAAALAEYVAAHLNEEKLQAELNDPANHFHFIYYNDVPAGYSKFILNQRYPAIEDAAVTKLERLYLLQAFHDQKLGATLFNFVTGLSKAAGQQGIWLFVWELNERAIRFYQKAGFSIVASADFRISATHTNPNHIMYLKF